MSKYRYERKFEVQHKTVSQIALLLRLAPGLFSEIYQARQINNIYFDSEGKSSYINHVDGISQRCKVRIRWYGSLFGQVKNPKLELKIKNGLVNRKETYKMAPFYVTKHFSERHILEAVQQSGLPSSPLQLLKNQQVSLMNQYSRRYFLSANGRYRFTIDYDMQYYHLSPHHNTFLRRIRDSRIIVELKYNENHDKEVDKIVSTLPFRLSKHSKYIAGVTSLHWLGV